MTPTPMICSHTLSQRKGIHAGHRCKWKIEQNYNSSYHCARTFECALTTLVFAMEELPVFVLVTAVIVTMVTEVGKHIVKSSELLKCSEYCRKVML